MKYYKLFLLPLALLLLLPNASFANRCAVSTTKAEFARADAVFSGEVVAQESRDAELAMADDQRKSKVRITATEFKVKNYWKGAGEKSLFLIDYQYGEQTNALYPLRRIFPFEINQSYLVYAYEFQNALQAAGRCTRTKLLNDAVEDLKTLGNAQAPTKTINKTLSEVLTEFIDKWNN